MTSEKLSLKAAGCRWGLWLSDKVFAYHASGAGYDSEKKVRKQRDQVVDHWNCDAETELGTSWFWGHAWLLGSNPTLLRVLLIFQLQF